MNQPDRSRVEHLRIRRDIMGEIYHKARSGYEQAARDYEDAARYDYRCYTMIRSGRNPIFCKLDQGHDGECVG